MMLLMMKRLLIITTPLAMSGNNQASKAM